MSSESVGFIVISICIGIPICLLAIAEFRNCKGYVAFTCHKCKTTSRPKDDKRWVVENVGSCSETSHDIWEHKCHE